MLKLSETKIEKSYTTCSDTDRTNILSICRQTSVEVSLRMHLFYTIKNILIQFFMLILSPLFSAFSDSKNGLVHCKQSCCNHGPYREYHYNPFGEMYSRHL